MEMEEEEEERGGERCIRWGVSKGGEVMIWVVLWRVYYVTSAGTARAMDAFGVV